MGRWPIRAAVLMTAMPVFPWSGLSWWCRSATFTTVTDNQTEVEIKVVALDAAGPVTLGSFILQGITPARVGLPQVVVTFELSEEMVLLVTAHDRIDDQFKQLVIKDRLPTPPKERPT